MKRLRFDYYMQITYSEKVAQCYYTIKCLPTETDRQHLEEAEIELVPENTFCRGWDSFGNQTIYGSVEQEHDVFSFRIRGTVTAGITSYETEQEASEIGIYRYPYGLTRPGQGLMEYLGGIKLPEKSTDYDKGVILIQHLYQDFTYEKNVTDVTTTAEKAWSLGRGVCQDYAHILIALCRMAGIPARYVAGMLIGEGYSHAWVEIFSDGRWYGLDPTNNLLVTDSHIKIGTGRDASDCMINRGVLKGGGTQTQNILVNVEEIQP